MKDHPFRAHEPARARRGKDVAEGLFHPFPFPREIDEIRRVHADLHPRAAEGFADGTRLFVPHVDPSAEGIFKTVEPHIFHEGRGVLAVFIAGVEKTLRVAARPESDHLLSTSLLSRSSCAFNSSSPEKTRISRKK